MNIPNELKKVIGDEPIDFCVFAKKTMSLAGSIASLIFGVVFIAIPLIILYITKDDSFEQKDEFDWGMVIFCFIFGFAGLLSLIAGIASFFQTGGYFVGTPNKLFHYKNQNIDCYDYAVFVGVSSISTAEKSLTYTLKTGETYKERIGDRTVCVFECYKIEMVGIQNFLEIDKIIQQRITENTQNN